MANGVLCRYFFQQTFLESGCEQKSWKNRCSSFLLSSRPTLLELQERFPFFGRYHFRALRAIAPSQSPLQYFWMDLIDENAHLHVGKGGIVYIKVLQLSDVDSRVDSNEANDAHLECAKYKAYFMHMKQGVEHSNSSKALDGSQSLNLKTVQSNVAQVLQRQSQKIWDKMALHFGTHSEKSTIVSGAAMNSLAKLTSAFNTRFDKSIPEHMGLLHKLWIASYDAKPFVHCGDAWKAIGFRTVDPACELENVLVLQSLVFFHLKYRQEVLLILHANTYPMVEVACRVVYLLSDILQLRDGSWLGTEQPYWRLFEDEDAWLELFGLALRRFYQAFDANNVSANQVADSVRITAEFALELLLSAPDSVAILIQEAAGRRMW